MNGLVGAKNKGRGRPTYGKKRKQMDKVGLKTGGGEGKPKEKRENEWIRRGSKKGGGGRPT